MSARNSIRWACATILIASAAACADPAGPTVVGSPTTELVTVNQSTAMGIGTSPTGPTRPGANPVLGVGTSPRPQP